MASSLANGFRDDYGTNNAESRTSPILGPVRFFFWIEPFFGYLPILARALFHGRVSGNLRRGHEAKPHNDPQPFFQRSALFRSQLRTDLHGSAVLQCMASCAGFGLYPNAYDIGTATFVLPCRFDWRRSCSRHFLRNKDIVDHEPLICRRVEAPQGFKIRSALSTAYSLRESGGSYDGSWGADCAVIREFVAHSSGPDSGAINRMAPDDVFYDILDLVIHGFV